MTVPAEVMTELTIIDARCSAFIESHQELQKSFAINLLAMVLHNMMLADWPVERIVLDTIAKLKELADVGSLGVAS